MEKFQQVSSLKLSAFEPDELDPKPPLPQTKLTLPAERPVRLAYKVPRYAPFPACDNELDDVKYELRDGRNFD